MELFKCLLIIWCLCVYVESFQLECVFIRDYQECEVKKLKVLENDVAVTSLSGLTDVERNKLKWIVIVQEVETEIVPTEVCNFLQNLEDFFIYGEKIKRINRAVFTNCKKVNSVGIEHTSLTTLPEDLFMDLILLDYISISNNKLVSLPADLLLNNKKLTVFHAFNNKLHTIDTVLPSIMTIVNFRNNTCIDKRFPYDISDLEVLKIEVASKCASSMTKEKTRTIESEKVALNTTIEQLKATIESMKIALTEKETNVSKLEEKLVVSSESNKLLQENLEKMEASLRSQAIAFNKTLAENKKEIENLKQNKETYESEKVALVTNITQKIATIEIFKIEIEALKKNNTQELSNVLEEINIIKSNFTHLANTLTEKETNASKLEEQLFNCNQNNKLLQANLTQNDNFKFNETNASLEKCLMDLSTFNELNEETGILKKKKETFERENLVLSTNITQLMSTIENLKNENEELQTDNAANGMEKSAEWLSLESENKRLKSNYEDLMRNMANLMKPQSPVS